MLQKKSLLVGMVFSILVLFGWMTPHTVQAFTGGGMVSECVNDVTKCQENSEADAQSEKNEPASVSINALDYIKIFFSLIIVIGLLVMVLKFLNKSNLQYQQNSTIRNIGGISVGAQKSVQVLQVGNSLFVVGVGDEVRLLKEISNPEEIEQLLAYYKEKQGIASAKPHIFDVINNMRNKKQVETPSFEAEFQKKMAEIKQDRTNEIQQWKEQDKESGQR